MCEMKNYNIKSKKIAVCCATPFQIFNALNLVINILKPEMCEIDLFVRNFSVETKRIIEKIKEHDLFENIYEYNLYDKEKKITYYYNDLIQAINPYKFIQSILSEKVDIHNKEYDYITITSGTELEVALTRVFSEARTIAYDDGLGSYIGDIVHDHKLNFIWRILGRRTNRIWPDVLYVNNKKFCESRLAKEIIKLPQLKENKEYLNIVQEIFDYKVADNYFEKNIIYLTQPLDEIRIIKNVTLWEQFYYVIEKYSDNGIVRIHPRDKEQKKCKLEVDSGDNLWELICAMDLRENHILISICSTTQIIPKILFDKEPYLIFLYRMFRYEDNMIPDGRFTPIVKKIITFYRNKNKIFVPKDVNELEQILQIIGKE